MQALGKRARYARPASKAELRLRALDARAGAHFQQRRPVKAMPLHLEAEERSDAEDQPK
jgi:hypothetical protein